MIRKRLPLLKSLGLLLLYDLLITFVLSAVSIFLVAWLPPVDPSIHTGNPTLQLFGIIYFILCIGSFLVVATLKRFSR